MKPCLTCGEPSPAPRCTECENAFKAQNWPDKRRRSTRGRGYGTTWRRLSERARAQQPFCVECGREESLTADHKPSAWHRRENGLPIRLEDIDVVCNGCNSDRGSSRPGTPRYAAWLKLCAREGRLTSREDWGDGVTGVDLDPGPQGTETVCIRLCSKGVEL